MEFINSLFEGATDSWSGGIAHIMIIISTVIALGKILGKCKICGVSLGVTWVLFTGIAFGHFGLTINQNLLHFLKEFGLILFVYSIGLQVGPGFFSSLKSGGLPLNALAATVIISGVGTALAIKAVTGTPAAAVTGIMSGAVTNTPGLGAAQQAYFDTIGTSAPDIALGYAVAYPFGVIGCIMTFILMRKTLYRTAPACTPRTAPASAEKTPGNSPNPSECPNLIPIFTGIATGCILGSIPVAFPGIPQPVKLGHAGGPLIVSILISHFGPRFKVMTCTTENANYMLREIGIALFLACVGLEAGDGFVGTVVHGGGLKWIMYGALITVIPLVIGGVIGRYVFRLGYNTLIGVLAGAYTNPPALAFACECGGSGEAVSIGYATVYPLAMFLRVLAAQLMILLFV